MKTQSRILACLLALLSAAAAPAQEPVTVYEDVVSLTGCEALRRLSTRIPKECVKKKLYDTSVLGKSRGAPFRSLLAKKPKKDWEDNTPQGGFSTRVLQFGNNSTEITPQGKDLLYEVETAMKFDPSLSLRIEGHTDSTGSEMYNQALSERRVAAVVTQFESGLRQRLHERGFGETRPLPAMPSTDPYNRRVEIIRVTATPSS
ncbi:OmpA family protein [Niveispirillum sp. KHB5.9]|uniref:OmpA family protein n=1 Tax=Niveispirillum sp. KHB5.9 TaxID=3400269 RepID=UPI003A867471